MVGSQPLPLAYSHWLHCPSPPTMSIEFYCTNCSKQLRVADDKAGKKCKCPSCQTTLAIPTSGEPTITSTKQAAEEDFEVKVEIGCPKCHSLLLYSPDLEGTRGLCKACGHIFTLTQDAAVEIEQSSFPFQCPNCQFMFEGKPGMEGRKGKCTECSQVFEIKRMEATTNPTLPSTDSKRREGPAQDFQSTSIAKKSLYPKPTVSLSLNHPSFEDEPLEPLRPQSPGARSIASTTRPTNPTPKPTIPVAKPVVPAAQPVAPIARPVTSAPVPSSTASQGWDSLPIPGPASFSQSSNPYAATVTTSNLPTQSYGSRSLEVGSLITQLRVLGVIYIILGCLGILLSLYLLLVYFVGISTEPTPVFESAPERAGRLTAYFLFLATILAIPIVQIIVIVAGANMLRFRGRSVAIMGSILAIVPVVSPLCLLGIPFGIWGLIVLLQSETKRLFR
jgi:DNA-directed RNA polymerase subunit M/transcription elongation factor TFIIS